MNFKFQDLEIKLALDEADKKDRSWFALIGCGPQSVKRCTDTQPRTHREQPIDLMFGLSRSQDLEALQKALRDLLDQAESLHKKVLYREEELRSLGVKEED